VSTSLPPSSDFFTTPLLNGLLAQVVQLVRFGDGLPIIYGEQGIGKSAVALEVSSRLASDGVVVCIDCREYISDFSVFLTFALTELGYSDGEVTSAGEGLSQLRNFSRLLLENQRLAVLVLDNADVLDDMSLAALLSLAQGQGDNGAGLRFVFTGHVNLVDRIDKLDIVDVGVYDFELSSLSPLEAEDFIAFSASKRGLSLSKESAASLWSASKGNPSKILALIEQTPIGITDNIDQAPQASWPDLKKIPIWHAVTVAVLFVALIWVFLSKGDSEPKTVAVEIINLPEKTAKLASIVGTQEKIALEPPAALLPEINDLAPIVTLGEQRAVPPEQPSMPSIKREQQAVSDHQKKRQLDKPRASTVIKEGTKTAQAPPKNPLKSVSTAEPKPVIPAKVTAKPQTELAQLLERSRNFINSQSKSSYALQVLALSNQDALMKYIRRQPNKNVLRVIKAKRGSSMLYIVVTGVFTTKERAQRAINDLPLVQRQAKPWPKTYELIQADMQN